MPCAITAASTIGMSLITRNGMNAANPNVMIPTTNVPNSASPLSTVDSPGFPVGADPAERTEPDGERHRDRQLGEDQCRQQLDRSPTYRCDRRPHARRPCHRRQSDDEVDQRLANEQHDPQHQHREHPDQ
jgi:hypothetical protein